METGTRNQKTSADKTEYFDSTNETLIFQKTNSRSGNDTTNDILRREINEELSALLASIADLRSKSFHNLNATISKWRLKANEAKVSPFGGHVSIYNQQPFNVSTRESCSSFGHPTLTTRKARSVIVGGSSSSCFSSSSSSSSFFCSNSLCCSPPPPPSDESEIILRQQQEEAQTELQLTSFVLSIDNLIGNTYKQLSSHANNCATLIPTTSASNKNQQKEPNNNNINHDDNNDDPHARRWDMVQQLLSSMDCDSNSAVIDNIPPLPHMIVANNNTSENNVVTTPPGNSNSAMIGNNNNDNNVHTFQGREERTSVVSGNANNNNHKHNNKDDDLSVDCPSLSLLCSDQETEQQPVKQQKSTPLNNTTSRRCKTSEYCSSAEEEKEYAEQQQEESQPVLKKRKSNTLENYKAPCCWSPYEPPLTVHVGGVPFVTRLSTLCSESDTYFTSLLHFDQQRNHNDGHHHHHHHHDHIVIVDRHPDTFQLILNYLANPKTTEIDVSCMTLDFRQRLLEDIQFYNITSLMTSLGPLLRVAPPPTTTTARPSGGGGGDDDGGLQWVWCSSDDDAVVDMPNSSSSSSNGQGGGSNAVTFKLPPDVRNRNTFTKRTWVKANSLQSIRQFEGGLHVPRWRIPGGGPSTGIGAGSHLTG